MSRRSHTSATHESSESEGLFQNRNKNSEIQGEGQKWNGNSKIGTREKWARDLLNNLGASPQDWSFQLKQKFPKVLTPSEKTIRLMRNGDPRLAKWADKIIEVADVYFIRIMQMKVQHDLLRTQQFGPAEAIIIEKGWDS